MPKIPRLLLLVLLATLAPLSAAPEEVGAEAPDPAKGDAAGGEKMSIPFPDPRITVSGLAWWKEEPVLRRLPERLKGEMPPKVWRLAHNTSGVRLRFRTDSRHVGIDATTGTYKLAPSPPTALIGMDLYSEGRYLGSALPDETGSLKKEWIVATEPAMRDIEIYFPIGSQPVVHGITLDAGSKMEPARPYGQPKPVVYYGSSITQGAQASNPGITFPCILGRWLDTDFIDLGFAGNGLGEPALASACAEIDASVFVVDYWANPSPDVYKKNFPGFIRILREKHPDTPIIVTGPYYNPSEVYGSRMGGYQIEKRRMIPELVKAVQDAGDKNITYIDGWDFVSPDTADALSDGRHVNSYGMFLYARGLEPHLRKALNLPPGPPR